MLMFMIVFLLGAGAGFGVGRIKNAAKLKAIQNVIDLAAAHPAVTAANTIINAVRNHL